MLGKLITQEFATYLNELKLNCEIQYNTESLINQDVQNENITYQSKGFHDFN